MPKQTKQEYVYQAIRGSLLRSEYAFGTQLTEEQLCQNLGVSRTPVREAIRRLTAEGLLESTPGIGLMVPYIRLDDLIEIYEMREGLECLAIRLFLEKSMAGSPAPLSECLFRQQKALEQSDFTDFMKWDMEFHHIIYHGTNNRRLARSLDSIYEQVNRLALSNKNDHELCEIAFGSHQKICDAVLRRDIRDAVEAARSHIEALKKHYLKLYYNL